MLTNLCGTLAGPINICPPRATIVFIADRVPRLALDHDEDLGVGMQVQTRSVAGLHMHPDERRRDLAVQVALKIAAIGQVNQIEYRCHGVVLSLD